MKQTDLLSTSSIIIFLTFSNIELEYCDNVNVIINVVEYR